MRKISIIGIITALLLPSFAYAGKINLFTLHRENYKPHKQLRYDLSYNPQSCTINKANPLDVYYENISSGQRLRKFSSNSRKYFSPSWKASQLSQRKFQFSFKALNEIKKFLGRSSLVIHLDSVNGKCQVTTEVTYPQGSFDLRHISVQVKSSLGFPTGVKTVELQGVRNGSYFVKKITAE